MPWLICDPILRSCVLPSFFPDLLALTFSQPVSSSQQTWCHKFIQTPHVIHTSTIWISQDRLRETREPKHRYQHCRGGQDSSNRCQCQVIHGNWTDGRIDWMDWMDWMDWYIDENRWEMKSFLFQHVPFIPAHTVLSMVTPWQNCFFELCRFKSTNTQHYAWKRDEKAMPSCPWKLGM